MEKDMKVNYLKPAVLTIIIVLFFACLSQSCGATKERIGRYVASPRVNDSNSFKWGLNPMIKPDPVKNLKPQEKPPVEEPKKETPPPTPVIPSDSAVDYSKLILENQKKGLSNDEIIINLLKQKDAENKNLKDQNKGLSQKSKISEKIKDDAVGLQAIWDMGKVIIYVGVIAIILLIGQIGIMVYKLRSRQARLGH